MPETRQRLIRCFSAIFPSLEEGAIENLGPAEFESWDSIDLVSLFAVVGDEFGIDGEELVEDVDSFESMLQAVDERL